MPQYRPLGTAAAPATWTLPASLELAVNSVYASYDGTGAAGSYIPTLEVISDAGDKVVSIPQDASVAAGSSVEASWAPFLKGTTAAGTTPNAFYMLSAYNAATVVSGVDKVLVLGSTQTNDAADVAFHTTTGAGAAVELKSQAYVYVVTATVSWAAFAGNRTFKLSLSAAEWGFAVPQQLTTTDDVQTLTSVIYCESSVPTDVTLTCAQASGGNQTVNNAHAMMQAVQLHPFP